MKTFRVLDLFCGTGGFSKGFEDDGNFSVVYGLDLLHVAVDTFRLNHPDALADVGDIRAIPPVSVAQHLGLQSGELDVIIGGPPCQGFSSIRPYRSSNNVDHRNSLFREFAHYVEYFHPRIFVIENVVGLVTYNNGRVIEDIEETFARFGYNTDWRIMNAAHFGVPQKRERLIMLGVEQGIPLSFPQPTHTWDGDTIGLQNKQRMLLPVQRDLFNQGASILPRAVTAADAIDDLPPIESGESATTYIFPPRTDYQAARRAACGILSLHASTAHSPRMLEIIRHSGSSISSIPEHLISSGFSSCYSRLAADEPSVTITVNFVHPASNRCIHPTQDRALTPREGARLQGFDDHFQFAGSRTQIVKQIGNAVPPLLGRAIASHVARLLGAPEMGYGQSRVVAADG